MNTNQPLVPWLASSTDPTQVANWIKGLILSSSSLIIGAVLVTLHIQVTTVQIDALATGVSFLAGAIWFLYGLIHHGVASLGKH